MYLTRNMRIETHNDLRTVIKNVKECVGVIPDRIELTDNPIFSTPAFSSKLLSAIALT
jgi:hypothetical protein